VCVPSGRPGSATWWSMIVPHAPPNGHHQSTRSSRYCSDSSTPHGDAHRAHRWARTKAMGAKGKQPTPQQTAATTTPPWTGPPWGMSPPGAEDEGHEEGVVVVVGRLSPPGACSDKLPLCPLPPQPLWRRSPCFLPSCVPNEATNSALPLRLHMPLRPRSDSSHLRGLPSFSRLECRC